MEKLIVGIDITILGVATWLTFNDRLDLAVLGLLVIAFGNLMDKVRGN